MQCKYYVGYVDPNNNNKTIRLYVICNLPIPYSLNLYNYKIRLPAGFLHVLIAEIFGGGNSRGISRGNFFVVDDDVVDDVTGVMTPFGCGPPGIAAPVLGRLSHSPSRHAWHKAALCWVRGLPARRSYRIGGLTNP